ncbi:MAG: ABC transporter substrate-binding protein, partial [Nitrospinota bacterium]
MRRIALVCWLAVAVGAWPLGAGAAPKDDTLVLAFKSDMPTMDPHVESSAVENARSRWVLQTLLHRTPEGKLIPFVAKGWKWVGEKTLEIELNPGIKFSNGEELDAEAVKYSLMRIHDPKLKSRQIERFRVTAHKDAIEVADKYKVRIRLASPDGGFPNRLGNLGQVVAPKYYSSHEPPFLARTPIGSGPYVVKKWERDTLTEYELNPHFRSAEYPKVKRVIVKIIPEEAARVAALTKGEVDVIFDVPTEMFDRINQSGKARVVSKPGIRTFRLGMYNKWPGVLSDKRVRMAIAHAIDRETLFKTVLKGSAVDESQVLHPFTEGYVSPKDYPYPYPYDPAKAKKLLAEAGYPNGIDIDFVTEIGTYIKVKEASEVLAGMLNKAGIRTKYVGLGVTGYRNYFRKYRSSPGNDFKSYLYFHSFGGGGGDSDLQLSAVFGCGGAWSGWCDKELDKMVDRASASSDDEERHRLFMAVTKKGTEDVAAVPLYRVNATFGLSNRVDWDPRVD